ncbi:MAG: SecD/SecF/SecDF export rane protein:SecD export rane protein, partial [Proteobacteria bacterium]|nr:SecD/SecF/SecDF export rane protein:SecD export rane protein [Pseudomonadota bacterium]
MNRYPLWVYVTIAAALVIGFLYTLPNFFGESPAVQVSSAKATIKVDQGTLGRVESALKENVIEPTGVFLDTSGVKARFANTDTQLKARDAIERALNPDPTNPSYTVALNLLSASPAWLRAIHALPMYLGLDLRGGVHFLLQIDMRAAVTKRLDSLAADIRSHIRDKKIRGASVSRVGNEVVIQFQDAATLDQARAGIESAFPELLFATR